MIFAFLGPNELSVIERYPYHRGVRKERLHSISFFFGHGKDDLSVIESDR